MRRVYGFALLVCLVALAGCGKKEPDAGGGPGSAALEGTYQVVGIEAAGQPITEEQLKKAPDAERKFEFKGNQVTANITGKAAPANLKVDATKTPHEIDILAPNEPMYGIYKLEGGTLTLCLGKTPETRPREFRGSDKNILITLRKQ